MDKTMTWVAVALLTAGTASAGIFTLTDGGSGTPYGDLAGFVVDIDATYNSSWDVDLVAGQQYRIDSISVWEASDAKNPADSTPVYLSVFDTSFAGFDGDTAAEYLVHSDNAIDHTATPDTSKITYTFTDLIVTAGNDGWLGNGALYFFWDSDTTRNNWGAQGVHPLQRIDSNPAAADNGAAIYAFGAVQGSRVPEIEISVTAIPEPATMGLVGIFGAGVLFVRRRFMI